PLAHAMGAALEELDAAVILEEAQGEDRHRLPPSEPAAVVDEAGGFPTAHGDDARSHQPGAEGIGTEPVAATGDESVALAQEGERAVRHAEAGDRVLLSGPGIGMRSGQVGLRSGCWSGTEGGGRGSPGDAQAGGRGAGAAPIAGRATGTQPRPA